jgi:hypothetical protein
VRDIVFSLTPKLSANVLLLIKQSPVFLVYSITYANTRSSVGFSPNLNKSFFTIKNSFAIICPRYLSSAL